LILKASPLPEKRPSYRVRESADGPAGPLLWTVLEPFYYPAVRPSRAAPRRTDGECRDRCQVPCNKLQYQPSWTRINVRARNIVPSGLPFMEQAGADLVP